MVDSTQIMMNFSQYWEVFLLFFAVAVVYSSVGFGGGSSYLALLTFTTLSFMDIRSTALLCNIMVVTGSVFLFLKNNQLDFKKVLPLVVASVPMSFLGGYLRIEQTVFFILLGVTLLLAALFMWFSAVAKENTIGSKTTIGKSLLYGAGIGLLSGMVGIGGGIFLSPLLYLTQWDTAKKIAATASFFILVNSVSGLLGQWQQPNFTLNWNFLLLVLPVVLIGGQIGVRLNLQFLSPKAIRRFTVMVVAVAGIRILWKYLL